MMSRVRKLFSFVAPSILVGGLLFTSAHAHDGRDSIVADAGDTSADRAARRAPRPIVAQGPTPPRAPRAPQPPPLPPPPPHAPHVPHAPHAPLPPGISIQINGNKIDLSGIEGMVRGQLDGVRASIKNNPHIPPQMRTKILARLDKVRVSVDKRLAKIRGKGLHELGDELEKLGEDIEQALEGLDEELEQLGDQLGKDIHKKLKGKKFKFDFDFDSDDDDDDDDDDGDDDISDAVPMTPDLRDADSDDMRDALNDLRGLAIKPDQKAKLAQLRAESDGKVAAARKQLDELSRKFEVALGDPRTSDAEIRRYVDAISAQEAEIRKARILAWVNARRILDDNQRKRIEAAAAKKRSK